MHLYQKMQYAVLCLAIAIQIFLSAQSEATDNRHPQQQSSGMAWAQQAMVALTGGNPVNSVTESGSVTRTIGNDQESGSITLQSTGIMNSQITISTGAGNRSETRSWDGSNPSGQWTGLNGQPHQMAQHNCWSDGVWFFPALSLLSDYSDPTLVFTDLGQQQYSGGSVEHIQIYRNLTSLAPPEQQVLQRLSTVDYYLDSRTALPVAMAFLTHGDQGVNFDLSAAIVFSQYQSVNGIQVPFQVTRLLSGSSYVQITITSASPSGQNSPSHRQ